MQTRVCPPRCGHTPFSTFSHPLTSPFVTFKIYSLATTIITDYAPLTNQSLQLLRIGVSAIAFIRPADH